MANKLEVEVTGKDSSKPTFESVKGHADGLLGHLSGINHALEEISEKFTKSFNAGTVIGEIGAGAIAAIAPLALLEKSIEFIHEGLSKLLEFTKEGILKADEVRDLGLSLSIVTGGAHQAGEAMEFFESHVDATRDGADDLARVMRDLNPLLSARGFSMESQQEISLMLSQLATIRGVSLEAMEGDFKQLASGKVAAGNQLLQTLGFTKKDIDGLGWDELISRMRATAAHFPEFGQSFQSELTKIKEGLYDAFTDGFNDARESAEHGMSGIKAAIQDPEIHEALRQFGEYTSRTLGGTAAAAVGVAAAIRGLKVELADKEFITTLAKLAAYGAVPGAGVAGSVIQAGLEYLVTRGEEASAEALRRQDTERGMKGFRALREADIAGKFELSKSEWGHGGFDLLDDLIGRMANEAKTDQFKTFMKEIVAATRDGILTMKEFRDAKAKALAGPEDGQPHGKVGFEDNAKAIAAARKEAEALSATLAKNADVFIHESEKVNTSSVVFAAYADMMRDVADINGRAGESNTKLAHDFGILGYSSEVLDALHNLNEFVRLGEQLAGDKFQRAMLNYIHNQPFFKRVDDPSQLTAGAGLSGSQKPLTPEELLKLHNIDQDTLYAAMNPANIPIGRDFADVFRDSTKDSTARMSVAISTSFSVGASAIGSAIANGGDDFVESIRSGFSSMASSSVAGGIDSLISSLIGVRRGDAGAGQDPTKYYMPGSQQAFDTQSSAVNESNAGKKLSIGVVGAESLISSYGASRQQDGSRTMGVAEGAIAGAAVGGWVGALVGAIGGLIGGVLGEQARQADYKFGKFGVSEKGWAYGYNVQNFNSEELKDYVSRIQETHDTTRDSLIRLVMKFPGYDIPDMPDGGFKWTGQDRASSHTQKHIEQYISNTLERDEMGVFKGELGSDFERFGISMDRFGEIWAKLERIDPTKAIGLLGQLADSLITLNQATSLFHSKDYESLFGAGSHVFEAEMTRYGAESRETYGQRMRKDDTDIIGFASGIHELSIQGQIQAESELAAMVKARADLVKQEVKEIFDAMDDGAREHQAFSDQLALARFMKADGSPDFYAQAEYDKKRLEDEAKRLGVATSGGQAQQEYEASQQWIQAALNAGLAQAVTTDDKKKWLDWAQQQEDTLYAAYQGVLVKLGTGIDAQTDAFNKQFDPIFHALTNDLTQAATDVKDFGDTVGGAKDPFTDIGDAVNNASTSVQSFTSVIDQASGVMNEFISFMRVAMSSNGSASNASYSSSNYNAARAFEQSTIAQRIA
jgi:hypothetical protein